MQPDPNTLPTPAAPRIAYVSDSETGLLPQPGTLAVIGFGEAPGAGHADPRRQSVGLSPASAGRLELWQVEGTVRCGREGRLRWAEGGGWLYAALDQPDTGGDIAEVANAAYAALTAFLRAQPRYHVQRLWNYLDDINAGDGDRERYRQFCRGRLRGMDAYFDDGFPAATAIGHPGRTGYLQVYCLAARAAGHRIENPRQMSAWRYPRQYGPVSPSFARAMRLPAGDGLAISGTASIQGHSSRHDGDLEAQLGETLTNLRSLLSAGRMSGQLGPRSPLKAYVRHAADLRRVDDYLARALPDTPRLVLQADICRSELLVEIDGWHFV